VIVTVTLKDVARKAGVSPITVSRAFSGTHHVSPATKQRVLAAAEALGYTPHLMARALASKHNPMIGIVVIDLSNPFFAPVINAIQEAAQQAGYLTIISQSKSDRFLEETSLKQLHQMRVAGVLPMSIAPQLEHLDRLRAAGLPVVSVTRPWAEGDFVAADLFAGGYLAGEHLCRLGHQQIACVAAQPSPNHLPSWNKFQGFQAALQDYHVPFSAKQVIWTKKIEVAEGITAADQFLQLTPRPTAVFVTADHQAVGFLHRLRERGLRVPDDVAVVGHDDIRYAEFMEVPLTTISLPKHEIGYQATQILLKRIKNKAIPSSEFQQILLKPKLIVRSSCGSGM
jgi:LacI family transcriptional regulator